MHRLGIKPRSPAWQTRILPLNHQCHSEHLQAQLHAAAVLALKSLNALFGLIDAIIDSESTEEVTSAKNLRTRRAHSGHHNTFT